MDDEKVIVLPEAADMLRRLREVYDDPEIERNFYPRLVQYASDEVCIPGTIARMFMWSIVQYVWYNDYPDVMIGLLNTLVPAWIDAVVDDREFAEEAKAVHKEAKAENYII